MSDFIKEKIKDFVKEYSEPSVSKLLQVDSPKFEMISYLAKKLSNVSLKSNLDELTQTTEFKTPSGQTLLKVEMSSNKELDLTGDLSEKIMHLLSAIRVHEVESYEWVYLLPEMRKSLLDEYAKKVNTTKEELRSLTTVWTS
jgi:hypothetical protein